MLLKRVFTLVELVVVLAIIMVVAGIVALSFRGESDSVTINNAALELEAFIAMVRYRAAESGRDFVVKFQADGKSLIASPDYSKEELEKFALENVSETESHTWKVTDKCQLTTASGMERDMHNDDAAEVLRFFPDGGGSSVHSLVMKCGKLTKIVKISFLTGHISIVDGDGEDEEGVENSFPVGFDGVPLQ